MSKSIFRAMLGAIAICLGFVSTISNAQTASPGTCEIYRDFDYKGASGNVVGNQQKGDAVIFTDQANAPADLVGFLSNKVGYRVFYDKSWNNSISSVKVAAGCTVELHGSLKMQQGSVMPFKSYTSDTPRFNAADNDKAQMVICRCK